jgi:hypothetical protein
LPLHLNSEKIDGRDGKRGIIESGGEPGPIMKKPFILSSSQGPLPSQKINVNAILLKKESSERVSPAIVGA